MQISEEDKQALVQVKSFFNTYKNWIIGSIVLVVLPILGYQFYENIKKQEKIASSDQFVNLVQLIENKEYANALEMIKNLDQEKLSKPYAKENLFLQAEIFYKNNQIDKAIESLNVIIDAEKESDSVFYHLANIQLIRLLIEKNQYLDAEEQINFFSETRTNYEAIYTYYQAVIHKLLNRNQKAKDSFATLIELTSNNRALQELARAEFNLIP